VLPLQQYLTDELFVTKKLTVSVMNVIKVLAKVEEANQLGRQLPPEAFYNELIRCDTLKDQGLASCRQHAGHKQLRLFKLPSYKQQPFWCFGLGVISA